MQLRSVLAQALTRIVPVSLVISVLAAALGYWHTHEVVREANLQALRLEVHRALAIDPADPTALQRDQRFARTVQHMVRGAFAVAQAYAPSGERVVEAVQPGFESLPAALAALPHAAPPDPGTNDSPHVMGQQLERIAAQVLAEDGRFLGHVEGVRIVQEAERAMYRRAAIESALIGMGAVLLCTVALAPLLTSLAQRNFRWARALLDAHLGMLEAFGRAIARRDSDTGLHNYRVTWIAARLGEEAGLSSAALRNLIAGAFLHDIGKIGIPDDVLLKPGYLNERERAIMHAHVEMGTYIVGSIGFLGAREVIAGHHECWDGSGYPFGLAGQDIPLNARIFCIADVYDALRAKRPYKDALPFAQAMETMQAAKGKHFDPVLFAVFERIVDEVEAKVIGASEAQAIALMRAMTDKHFLAEDAASDAEGWTRRDSCDACQAGAADTHAAVVAKAGAGAAHEA